MVENEPMPQGDGSVPLTEDVFCPRCGYNLRGGVGGRCPECGERYRPEELSASRIAWTNRGRLGRAKAWGLTVLAATFRTELVAESIQADLRQRDARRFWLMCVGLVWALLAAVLFAIKPEDGALEFAALFSAYSPERSWPGQVVYLWGVAARLSPVKGGMALAAAILLAMLPVRVSAMCRYPAAVRQRAIAAAHYVLGALLGGAAVGCVVAGLFWGACIAAGRRDVGGKALGAAVMLFAPATALLLWLFAAYRFHRRTTIVSGTAAPPFLLAFGLLMGLGIAVWLILVPWVIGLLWLIVVTWRG